MKCPRCHAAQFSRRITCPACQFVLYSAHLRFWTEGQPHATYALPLQDLTLGRGADNDLDLVAEGVSRRHLLLRFAGGTFHAADCGSKNGVFVNGIRVITKTLQDQDSLRLGAARLFFFLQECAAEVISTSTAENEISSSPASAAQSPASVQLPEEIWRDCLAQLLLEGALQIARAERASVWLGDEHGELQVQQEHPVPENAPGLGKHQSWQELAAKIYQSGSIMIYERAGATCTACDSLLRMEMSSGFEMLGIPLRAPDHSTAPAGVLLLEHAPVPQILSSAQALSLQALLERAAIFLQPGFFENARCAEHPGGERPSIVREAHAAAVRKKVPFDIAFASRPSGTVGGDYIDVIPCQGDGLMIAIGDVAGKGVAAAHLRDLMQACLRLHLLFETRLEVLAQALNRLMYRLRPASTFMTLFLGMLHAPAGILCYLNAGHNPGVMIYPPTSTPRFTLLRNNAAALGVLEASPMFEKTLTIPPGATLIFYTDGVTEATGADGKHYGLTRLIECATAGIFSEHSPSASRLLHLMLEDLPYSAALAAGVTRPQDDQSVLVLVAGKPDSPG